MINMIGGGGWFGADTRVFRENIIFIKKFFLKVIKYKILFL